MSFFNFNRSAESELYIDVNRKLVINSRNMTPDQELLYRRSFFMSARPDLTEWEKRNWNRKLYLGEQFLGQMRNSLQQEIQRVNFQYPLASRMEKISVNDVNSYSQLLLTIPFVQGTRPSANRNWIDQSKLVNYVEQKLVRLMKYGLIYPRIAIIGNKEDKSQLEEEVYQRFLREMLKPETQE